MNKCKCCGNEIKENIVKFPKLKIEVDFNQKQNNKELKDIVIRKGWRLLKLEELGEVMNYALENKLDIWSYCEQSIKSYKGKYVAGFYMGSGSSYFSCTGDPGDSDPGLGVVFCRDVKEARK